MRKLDFAPLEADYRADFEVLTKYQEYSSELLRISLLLLTGYGAMLYGIVTSERLTTLWSDQTSKMEYSLVMTGLFSLLISAAAALLHRVLSTAGFAQRIAYARHLAKLKAEPSTANPESTGANAAYTIMLKRYWLASQLLGFSACALALATLTTAVLFAILWPS